MAKQPDKTLSSASLTLVSPAPLGGRARTLTPAQTLYTARLTRLLRLKEEWSNRVPTSDWRIRLINKSIYSTYCDCVEAGLADDARELVKPKGKT
ncbi:MAG TPA: hypothetical protein VFZ25_18750 [Chloroflexota bacterium]|nr:hypothetical protein [Chloroflexota bacterium]